MVTAVAWDSEFKAHTVDNITDDHLDPRTIQLSNGNFLVAWWTTATTGVASPAGIDIVGRIFDPLGNEVQAEFRLNDFSENDDEFNFELTAHPNGGFSVIYEDRGMADYNIRIDSYFNSGTLQNSASIIADPDGNNGGDPVYRNPNVTSQSSSAILTTYEVFDDASNEVSIVGKIYNANTDTVGAEFDITLAFVLGGGEGLNGHSTTTLTTGEHVVFYIDRDDGTINDDVYFRILNSNGTQTGQPGQILVDSGFDFASDPHVVGLSNGNFLVTWTVNNSGNDTGIRARLYDNAGVAQTAMFSPPTIVAGDQQYPAVAALDGGKFVIVWHDEDTRDISGQVYNANGTTDGSEFTVVDYNGSTISDIDVTGFEDGRFEVSWEVNINDSGDREVYSRIMDPRTNANSDEAAGWQVGTIDGDNFAVDTGATQVHGWDGNDRITIDANQVGPLTAIDGGSGTADVLVVSNTGSVWNFLFENVSGFEEIEFSSGGSLGNTRNANFTAAQIAGINIFDFDSDTGDEENLGIFMGTATSLNLFDVDVQGFNSTDDTITIFGDGANESITGTDANDTILGSFGSDDLNGYDGNDILAGGADNDTLYGGAGGDVLDGGDGAEDKISYISSDAGVAVNLTTGSASGGHATGDTFAQVESIAGSDHNDSLTGDHFNNRLEGGGGSDDLNGLGGADTIIGGGGLDTIYYLSSPSGVTINLTSGMGFGGDAQGDTFDSIEWVHGSAHNDSMTGNSVPVGAFYGHGGNDHLAGFGGNDTYIGGAGNDTFYTHNTGGEDLISDFEGVGAAVGDLINLQDFGFGNFMQVQAQMTDAAVDIVKISIDVDDVLFVRGTGVSIATLTESDFLL